MELLSYISDLLPEKGEKNHSIIIGKDATLSWNREQLAHKVLEML